MEKMLLDEIIRLAGNNALLNAENDRLIQNTVREIEKMAQVTSDRGELSYKLEILETKIKHLQEKNNQLVIDYERAKKMLKAAEAEIKRLQVEE